MRRRFVTTNSINQLGENSITAQDVASYPAGIQRRHDAPADGIGGCHLLLQGECSDRCRRRISFALVAICHAVGRSIEDRLQDPSIISLLVSSKLEEDAISLFAGTRICGNNLDTAGIADDRCVTSHHAS